MLEPVSGMWRAGQGEVVFGGYPGLQGFQLVRGLVGSHMMDQVALVLVGQEVKVHRHRVTHADIPEKGEKKKEGKKPQSIFKSHIQ